MEYVNHYTYQTNALLPGIFLLWFAAAYELHLVSYGHKIVSKNASHAWSLTSRSSVRLFQAWHAQSGHTQTIERLQL